MKNNKILNYRNIIEKKLKRKLQSNEIVHHIDGNEHNNNINNIEILTSRKEHRLKGRIKTIIKDNTYEQVLKKLDKISVDSFRNALTQIFTDRQIQILFRKLNKQILSKTESEMYSRQIKKKLQALANNQLYEIANKVIGR